jgi:hypothetical protein
MARYKKVLQRPAVVADLRETRPAEATVDVAPPEMTPASDNPPVVDLGDVPSPEPVAEDSGTPPKRKRGRPRKNPA